jgi:exonuclease SbcD
VALGHLHRPQAMSGDRIHYSGSLLKYSFNEVSHAKSVSLVELGADGVPLVRRVALTPLRDVRIIKGKLAELLAQPDADLPRDDYLCAHLTDTDPVLDPLLRLRAVYPRMMELKFAATGQEGDGASLSGGDHRQRQPADLFRAFYRDMVGEDIDEPALEFFNSATRSVATSNEGTAP